jgi:methionyl-tRNA formyltransferase
MSETKKFKIVILSDSTSWINSTVEVVAAHWKELGHEVFCFHDLQELPSADFCFCLSFSQLISSKIRQKFRHTLVVHESDLPAGKGWSPLTWQILEGKNQVSTTLFEAADQVDSGAIYAQRRIVFEGHELVNELRQGQASATQDLCRWFVDNYPESISAARDQQGEESFYARRRPEDSELDPNKTIAEQFNLLRVVDNDRYPAFFELNGNRYYLTISKGELSQ